MSTLDLTEIQQAAYQAVEDVLIEFRDARLGMINVPNGVVVCEADGTPSSIVRMRTRHATDLAVKTAIPLIARLVADSIAAEIEAEAGDCGCGTCDERRGVLSDAAAIAREWSPA